MSIAFFMGVVGLTLWVYVYRKLKRPAHERGLFDGGPSSDGGTAARAERRDEYQSPGSITKKDFWNLHPSRRCFYYDDPSFQCEWGESDGTAEHIEHIHPLDRGGTNHLYNLVPADATFNRQKSNRLLDQDEIDRLVGRNVRLLAGRGVELGPTVSGFGGR